ncbi:MAG: homocysteine S-methyltransferase family protein [Myxococcota bacterium]
MSAILPNPNHSEASRIVVLDGAQGTELARRGVPTEGLAWSARAVSEHPRAIVDLHAAYAAAGATVHTAATFRTTPWASGPRAKSRTLEAVQLARQAVPKGHTVAGSLAPARDCYTLADRPSDAIARAEHTQHAEHLALAGVDLILCETFADPGETRIAVEAATSTGVETWVALTAGYRLDLCTPTEMQELAAQVADVGVTCVLVNCVPALNAAPFLDAVAVAGLPFGIYANAGSEEDGVGWGAGSGPTRYARLAKAWADRGATVIGGCCGTGPAHVAAIRKVLG